MIFIVYLINFYTAVCINVSNYDDYTDYVISDMTYDEFKNFSFRKTDDDQRDSAKRDIGSEDQSGDGGATEILFGTSIKPNIEELGVQDSFVSQFGFAGRTLITDKELDSVEFVYEPIEFVRKHSRRKSKKRKDRIRFSRGGLAQDFIQTKSDSIDIASFREKDMNNLKIHEVYSE